MALTGLEKTAIVLIVILVYYIVMMVISIILAKTNHPTAARWVKALSILNYPFKKLNEHSIHIDDEHKYSTIIKKSITNKALSAFENSDLGKQFIEDRMKAAVQAATKPPVETIHETVVEPLQPQPTQQADEATTTESDVF